MDFEDSSMCIYKITHKTSGTSYIGQTIYKLSRRWRSHCHPKSGCRRLRNAIQKYGESEFRLTVLEKCETLEQLNDREKFWIEALNTFSPNGYNLQKGGYNGIPSEETRIKMGAWQIGRTISPETRSKIAETSKKRIIDPIAIAKTRTANIGRKHTLESIMRVRVGRQKAQAAKDLLNPPSEEILLRRKRSVGYKLKSKNLKTKSHS